MTSGQDGPLLLAIDTASGSGGVALARGRLVYGEACWRGAPQQTTETLPAALRLCARAGVTPAALQAIAVSGGPGSYTGLRVGFSLAKGFALALGIPVVAVPTLEALAYQHRDAAPALLCVVDAGRGQLYSARFRSRDGGIESVGDVAVQTPDELGAALAAEGELLYVCGELYPDPIERLRARAAPSVRFVSPAGALRRPAFLAELGAVRLGAGTERGGDVEALQPLYVRRPA